MTRVTAWCLAHRWTLAVWGGMAVWFLVMFERVRDRHLGFLTTRFDLGNMVQAVWSTTQGQPLEVTETSGEQVVRLASHVDPILALLAPVWLVAPNPLALAGVQVGALALGALPVYWLGRTHLYSDSAAACLALAYLAYPWIAWAAIDAMHPVTLGIPLLLFAVWFLESDRIAVFAVCAVLAAMCGELMALTIVALGIWYALARGKARAGFLIAGSATIWTVIAIRIVIPAFGDRTSAFYGYFDEVGGSPEGVIRAAFTDPGAIVGALATRQDVGYLMWLAMPLLGVFLFAPGLAAVAVPQLLVNGLAARWSTTDPKQHYSAAVIPILVAATVLGLKRVSPARRIHVVGLVLVASTSLLLLVGPLPGSQVPDNERLAPLPSTHVEALRAAVALIPDSAGVTSTNALGAHLSARRYYYSFPVLPPRAEWVALDLRNPWTPSVGNREEANRPALMKSFQKRLERSAEWVKIFDRDGVLVFRKAAGA